MNVLPGGAFFQATQGVSAQPPKGVVPREAAAATALRAAEVTNGAKKPQSAVMVPDGNPSEKPRPNAPRGSIIDLKV